MRQSSIGIRGMARLPVETIRSFAVEMPAIRLRLYCSRPSLVRLLLRHTHCPPWSGNRFGSIPEEAVADQASTE